MAFRIASMMMLALWVLATSHCKLEGITGLEVLGCCPDEESVPAGGDPCETDACGTVEFGFYKLQDNPTLEGPPETFSAIDLGALLIHATDAADPALFGQTTAPPELKRGWQFILRAVAPARAPSLVA
jgi:hypothetical protein